MVRKKFGGWRLCADLTNLNKVLKPKKYALPHVSDFTFLAHGCNLFSSIDIADAYYKIRVRPEDRHKLTITTPLGNYKYNFLPMGLASSSTYFQLLMNEVLSGLPHVFCYLDDVIVMSKTRLEHRQSGSEETFVFGFSCILRRIKTVAIESRSYQQLCHTYYNKITQIIFRYVPIL